MKGKYLLDSDIASHMIRGNVKLLEQADAILKSGGIIAISAVTYFELRRGEIGKKAPASLPTRIRLLVDSLSGVMPMDTAVVDQSISIQSTLAAAGEPIGHNDSLIAAHSQVLGFTLVTRNTREFKRIPELLIEDWLT